MSTSMNKLLRQLAGNAYERELARELQTLEQQFACWHRGECGPFDVSDAIHRFHDGVARDLYTFYALNRDPMMQVARALEQRLIQADEIPEPLREQLEPLRALFRESGE